MSRSSLALWPDWRDYYSMWSPYVEPLLAPIERSSCHAPRFVRIPEVSQQVVPASGKIEYNFHLPAGSLIWGMLPPEGSAAAIQLTDVSLGHQFFQEPLQVNFLVTPGGLTGRMPPFTLLPTPHPVVGDGLFTFEAWDVPGAVFVMLLGVAEVTTCPVK